MTKFHWKLVLVAAAVVISLYLLAPSLLWLGLSNEKRIGLISRKAPIMEKVINLGLDLQGGMHLLLELDTSALPDLTPSTISEAIEQNMTVIRNRVDALGVREPFIARQGERWLVVQLPGVKESRQAKEILGKTALLEFRIVEAEEAMAEIDLKLRELAITRDQIQRKELPPEVNRLIPPETELLPSREGTALLVRSKAELTGAMLTKARVELGGEYSGYPVVGLEFNPEGARLFDAVTAANVERRLAIILDGIIQSAPVIRTRISGGRAVIEGTFSAEEAKLLANVLNSGALKAPMTIAEERTVGPTLGEDSIRAGLFSSLAGALLIFIFMAVYYRLSGLLADGALILNFILLMAGMAMLKATLTLPGVAGIILSIAMAVDANVLILERIREEIAAGKTLRFAIDEGYAKAFSAILDGNLTTLIAAVFLFQFGTGPIKGFGVSLMLGLSASMFTAITVTRTAYEAWLTLAKPNRLSI